MILPTDQRFHDLLEGVIAADKLFPRDLGMSAQLYALQQNLASAVFVARRDALLEYINTRP